MVDTFWPLPMAVQILIVIGAAGILRSWWGDRHGARNVCEHTWGRAYKVERICNSGLQYWRQCKHCAAVQQRYKVTRGGKWWSSAPIPLDESLPAAKVVER